MTNPYTPKKVAELIAEARKPWCKDCDHFIVALADALTAVSADRDRLHKAITEALAFESVLPAIATEPRRILRAALDKEGTDDAK